MQELIALLGRKCQCYKSFYRICNDFLDEISKGDLTNLSKFQNQRSGLLTVLENLESDTQNFLKQFDDSPGAFDVLLTSENKTQIQYLTREKDSLIQAILELDKQILKHIDRQKSDTIHKLQSVQSGKRTLGAYRSPVDSVERAEGKTLVDKEV